MGRHQQGQHDRAQRWLRWHCVSSVDSRKLRLEVVCIGSSRRSATSTSDGMYLGMLEGNCWVQPITFGTKFSVHNLMSLLRLVSI